jgi:hypothetical protein
VYKGEKPEGLSALLENLLETELTEQTRKKVIELTEKTV